MMSNQKKRIDKKQDGFVVRLRLFLYSVSMFAYAIRVKASISDLKDVLVAIIGALSGTLGFIVGFYYKSIKE